jgi:hypothetical protein
MRDRTEKNWQRDEGENSLKITKQQWKKQQDGIKGERISKRGSQRIQRINKIHSISKKRNILRSFPSPLKFPLLF